MDMQCLLDDGSYRLIVSSSQRLIVIKQDEQASIAMMDRTRTRDQDRDDCDIGRGTPLVLASRCCRVASCALARWHYITTIQAINDNHSERAISVEPSHEHTRLVVFEDA